MIMFSVLTMMMTVVMMMRSFDNVDYDDDGENFGDDVGIAGNHDHDQGLLIVRITIMVMTMAMMRMIHDNVEYVDDDFNGGNDDLEIAWNCLDVARVIYSRIDNTDAQLNLAKTQIRLGDCQMESDRFDQALEEYQSCLTIRSRLLPKHDR